MFLILFEYIINIGNDEYLNGVVQARLMQVSILARKKFSS